MAIISEKQFVESMKKHEGMDEETAQIAFDQIFSLQQKHREALLASTSLWHRRSHEYQVALGHLRGRIRTYKKGLKELERRKAEETKEKEENRTLFYLKMDLGKKLGELAYEVIDELEPWQRASIRLRVRDGKKNNTYQKLIKELEDELSVLSDNRKTNRKLAKKVMRKNVDSDVELDDLLSMMNAKEIEELVKTEVQVNEDKRKAFLKKMGLNDDDHGLKVWAETPEEVIEKIVG